MTAYQKMRDELDKGNIVVLTYKPRNYLEKVKKDIAIVNNKVISDIITLEEISKLPPVKVSNEDEKIKILMEQVTEIRPTIEKRKKKAPHFDITEMVEDLAKEAEKIGLSKLKNIDERIQAKIEQMTKLEEPSVETPVPEHTQAKIEQMIRAYSKTQSTSIPKAKVIFTDHTKPLLNFIDVLKAVIKYRSKYPVIKLRRGCFDNTYNLDDLKQNLAQLRDNNGHIVNAEAIEKALLVSDWRCDDYAFTFDYLFHEYVKNPRRFVVLLTGVKPPRWLEEQAIIITESALMRKLNLSRMQAKRFIRPRHQHEKSVIERVADTRIVLQGRIGGSEKEILTYILHPLDIATFWQAIEVPNTLSKKHYLFGVLAIRDLEHPGRIFQPYTIGELIFKLQQEQRPVFVETNSFARIKQELPSRTQTIAARLLARIYFKAQRAYITLEEMAELIGRSAQLKARKRKAILEKAREVLTAMQEVGVIKTWKWTGQYFEVIPVE